MTQALLNSLNIIKESSSSIKNKNYTDTGVDFAKILELANSKSDEKTKMQDNDIKTMPVQQDTKQTDNKKTDNETADVNKELSEKINTVVQNDENTATVIQDSKKETKTDNDKKSNDNDTRIEIDINTKSERSLKEIILEAAIETIAEECLTDDADSENTETAVNIEDTETTETQENEEIEEQETITNDENNITDEAPTMNKELTTLENPTAAVLLQTQIKTTTKHVVKENEVKQPQNSVKEPEISLKDTDVNSNLKNFDNDMSKISGTIVSPKTENAEKTDSMKIKTLLNEKVVKDLNVVNVQGEATNSGSAEGENLTQSPQEQVVKVMIQGDLKADNTFETVAKSSVMKPEVSNPSKIIEQISKQLENMGSGSKLTMVLNPENLGKVNIQLVTTKTGIMAQLTVTTPEARDLLMKGLDGLKENLLSQGIAVENVNIKLEESTNEENQFDWTEQEGSRGGYKQQESRRQKDEEQQKFEQLMFEYNNGNV